MVGKVRRNMQQCVYEKTHTHTNFLGPSRDEGCAPRRARRARSQLEMSVLSKKKQERNTKNTDKTSVVCAFVGMLFFVFCYLLLFFVRFKKME